MRRDRTPAIVSLLFGRRLLLLFALLVAACGGGGSGSDDATGEVPAEPGLLIRWQESADVEGYVIHWGAESGSYTHTRDVGSPPADADGVTSYVLDDVGAMGTVYFALTSYDSEGQMSGFSNEISADVP